MKSEAVMQFKRKKRKQPPPLSQTFLPKADIIESSLNTRSTGISIKKLIDCLKPTILWPTYSH